MITRNKDFITDKDEPDFGLDSPDSDSETVEHGLYEGDRGTLSMELRNVVITLLRGPYLFKNERPKVWDLLTVYRPKIREHLANLYLDLVCDDDVGIAYIRQADTGELEVPTLLNKVSYTLLDSVLIVELRDRLHAMAQRGERATISFDEIASLLTFFDPLAKTDQAGYLKHVSAVIERFKKRHFLVTLKAGNYEISPVLKVVFNASEVEQMAQAYRSLIGTKENELITESEENEQ